MSVTVEYVRDLSGFNGVAKLYKVTPAVPYGWNDEDEDTTTTEYVVASAVNGWAYETYIFPCDADGEVIDWLEMPGSMKGTNDHDKAMARFVAEHGAVAS